MNREKVAKVHGNRSQRANPRTGEDRKVVFKGVLDNPHRVLWPTTPVNVQNVILAHLVELLEGVADYHQECRKNAKKQRKLLPVANDLLRRNPNGDLVDVDHEPLPEELDIIALHHTAPRPEPPSIFKSLTYGINTVTKRLELQIESCRSKVALKSSTATQDAEETSPIIRYLFVCRADVNPSILIDHLPHLVATYNALRPPDLPPTILITLPKGAEATLAHAVGVRRLAVLAIDSSSTVSSERLAIANSLSLVTAPWLSSQPARSFIQTHIKQLRTTAPRDMRMAREARKREKAVAKTRRSSKKRVKAMPTELQTNQPALIPDRDSS